MNTWFSENWDKLLTLILGGLVGYFSGVIATNQSISRVREDIARLETAAKTSYEPAAIRVQEISLKLIGLENDLKNIKDQQALTDKLVELHVGKFQVELEKVRRESITLLKELLDDNK